MSHPVSGTMLVFNERPTIVQSVHSALRFVDDLVILDGGSTDGTAEVLTRIFSRHTQIKLYFEHQSCDRYAFNEYDRRTKAVSLCSHDWILSHDGDELLDKVDPGTFRNMDAPVALPFLTLCDWKSLIATVNGEVWHPINKITFFNRKTHKYLSRRQHSAYLNEKGEILLWDQCAVVPGLAIWHLHDMILDRYRTGPNVEITTAPLPRPMPVYPHCIS